MSLHNAYSIQNAYYHIISVIEDGQEEIEPGKSNFETIIERDTDQTIKGVKIKQIAKERDREMRERREQLLLTWVIYVRI